MANKMRSGSSGGGSGTPENTNDVLATMLSFNDDSKARAYLLTLNKFDEAERDEMMELYEATKEATGKTDFGSEFNSVYSTIRRLEDKGGSIDEAMNIMQRALDAGTLTNDGYEQLKKYFARFLKIE